MTKEEIRISYFAPYIDETGLHAPTRAERLEGLVEGYRSIYGEDIALTEDTPDYQLLAIFAKALDDMTGLLYRDLSEFDPDLSSGQQLSMLCRLNGIERQEGETDDALRLRRSRSVPLNAASTTEVLRARLEALPGMTYVKLVDNDTGTALPDGQPAHSLQILYAGASEARVLETICRYKPCGVQTWGSVENSWTDEDGVTHTVQYTPVSETYLKVAIEIRALSGYDTSTMNTQIRRALRDRINTLTAGQTLIVPSLYAVAYDTFEDPRFVILSLKAGLLSGSSMTATTLTPDARKWFRVNVSDVTLTVS